MVQSEQTRLDLLQVEAPEAVIDQNGTCSRCTTLYLATVNENVSNKLLRTKIAHEFIILIFTTNQV